MPFTWAMKPCAKAADNKSLVQSVHFIKYADKSLHLSLQTVSSVSEEQTLLSSKQISVKYTCECPAKSYHQPFSIGDCFATCCTYHSVIGGFVSRCCRLTCTFTREGIVHFLLYRLPYRSVSYVAERSDWLQYPWGWCSGSSSLAPKKQINRPPMC